MGALGGALVFLAHGPWAYWIAHVLIFPFSAALFGSLFALARLASANWPTAERDGIIVSVRALFALPFKLAFFVVADGWTLISGALVRSYF